jgi:hypothetical protein
MFTGIFFLSMPISIVGDSFTRSWNRYTAKKERMQLADKRSQKAEEKKAALERGDEVRTHVEGPHDALNADILGFFVKSRHRLESYRPLGEAGNDWDEALNMIRATESSWVEVYREIQRIA